MSACTRADEHFTRSTADGAGDSSGALWAQRASSSDRAQSRWHDWQLGPLIDGAAEAKLGAPGQRRRPRWTGHRPAVRNNCVKSDCKAADPGKHLDRRPYVWRTAAELLGSRDNNVCIGKDQEACLAGLRGDEEPGEDEEGNRPVSGQHLARAAGDVFDRIDVYADCVPGCAIRSRDGRDEASPTCPATTETLHRRCDCPDKPALNDVWNSLGPNYCVARQTQCEPLMAVHVRMSSALWDGFRPSSCRCVTQTYRNQTRALCRQRRIRTAAEPSGASAGSAQFDRVHRPTQQSSTHAIPYPGATNDSKRCWLANQSKGNGHIHASFCYQATLVSVQSTRHALSESSSLARLFVRGCPAGALCSERQ